MNNIVLTGFMGTGKTTTGRLLAARLRRTFVDTDERIAQRAAKEIDEIFATDGADAFREMEREIAAELAGQHNLVIATGGRLMLDPQNAARLVPDNHVFTLRADADEIHRRIAMSGPIRPLLQVADPRARIGELLRERAAGYAQFTQIATGGLTPQQVAQAILTAGAFQPQPPPQTPPHELQVTHPQGSYRVIVGFNLLPHFSQRLSQDVGPLAIISDGHVGPLFAPSLPAPTSYTAFAPGEANKTLSTVHALYDKLLADGMDRTATVIALGGGVVGDVAGFVAATYMRGIGLVQCPTSLLAVVDASVGGKTGVDLPQGKNLIGAFKQPLAVLADIDTLRTLPPAEFAGGMAEVVKHALLSGGRLLQRLEDNIVNHELLYDEQNHHLLQEIIVDAIKVKRDVVQDDPYESGRRALLNLGHTFAHAIERVTEYRISHGQAVAMGLVCAARLSTILGHCTPDLQERVQQLLTRCHLPIHIPTRLDPQALLSAMGSDKKKARGRLRFILMRDIGDAFISGDVPSSAVLQTLREVSRV